MVIAAYLYIRRPPSYDEYNEFQDDQERQMSRTSQRGVQLGHIKDGTASRSNSTAFDGPPGDIYRSSATWRWGKPLVVLVATCCSFNSIHYHFYHDDHEIDLQTITDAGKGLTPVNMPRPHRPPQINHGDQESSRGSRSVLAISHCGILFIDRLLI